MSNQGNPQPELDGIDLLDDLCFAIEARACSQSGSHHIAEIKAELIRRLSRADDAAQPIDAAKVNERIRQLMASNADLLDTLKGIANADKTTWDESCRDDASFKAWAKSRAMYAIQKHESQA